MEYVKRKNIRLPDYDYSQEGGYFVTVCTHERRCTLSHIIPGTEQDRARVSLSDLGKIADEILLSLPERYGFVLDACVIMPNHIHIIIMKRTVAAAKVGQFVGAFKSSVSTRWYKECDRRGNVAGKLWQRNYYDHVLRNEADHLEKLRYIDENPDKWQMDELYGK
ncbi:MAG: transposase [Oscillospiraceae bacterium]|nr:transposase [Oscillospiraceae bacterium]